MKYFIIAGEASGDLHASNLARGIKKADSNAIFEAWGGDLMQEQDVKINKHIKDLAFMGFTEVVAHLSTILKNFKIVKQEILNFSPDALILVDYPGFNMRIAKWAHKQGIKVYYYISPNVWAWKTSRVYKFKKYCEKLFVILPFEKDFYKKFDIDVEYEGHPLIDAVENFRNQITEELIFEKNQDKPIIALLAGSRKQEIKRMLPIMLKLPKYFPDYNFVVAGAPAIDKTYYEQFLKNSEVNLVMNKTYAVLDKAVAGVIVSGTASLEATIFNLPQVVGYRGSLVSALIARAVMKVKYIALPNLILDKAVVKELLQYKFNEKDIVKELEKILPGGNNYNQILEDYKIINNTLGKKGASERVGYKIVNLIKQ